MPPDEGFHGHLMLSFNGVITGLTLRAAATDEREALWELASRIHGLAMGDKGSLSAFLKAELVGEGIDLQTPLRANMADARDPCAVRRLVRTRRLMESVIGQLTERFHVERIRARDRWHLTSRMARKVLSHTLCIFLNRSLGRPDLQFEGWVTD